MNLIKKTALVLTMLVGLMTFASCGDKDDDDASKSSLKKSSSVSSADDDEEEDDEESEEDDEDEEAATKKKKSDKSEKEDEEDEEIIAEAEEEAERAAIEAEEARKAAEREDEDTTESAAASGTNFKQGTVSDNTYENEFLGIKFTAPSGFTYMSQSEINQSMNNGFEMTKTDSSVNDILKLTTIYDAVARNAKGETIQFMYENLSKSVPDPDEYDEEAYIKAASETVARVSTGMEMKVDNNSEKIKLGGKEFTKFTIKSTYPDYNITVDQILCVRKVDDFMCVVTYTSMAGGDFDDYVDCFEAID
ncbi:MAG: hypothetical protein IJM38_08820 [Ruminococcus sp.]|nr:hypothetical protein [Ruminococcus sp.]